MLNPKEAAEDSRALNVVILIFAAIAVAISIGLHFDSAMKYWLLTEFGETATGTIVRVSRAPKTQEEIQDLARENPRNYLKNSQTWLSGDSLLIEFQPSGGTLEYVLFKRPPGSDVGQHSQTLRIVYLPVNPQIAYPQDQLSDFAFDSKIMIGSLIAAAILLWLFIEAFVNWIRFRKKMRHY